MHEEEEDVYMRVSPYSKEVSDGLLPELMDLPSGKVVLAGRLSPLQGLWMAPSPPVYLPSTAWNEPILPPAGGVTDPLNPEGSG